MKAYCIRLLAVSLLTALFEYILPEGRVRRFVSPLLSLAVTAAVILPLLSIFQSSAPNPASLFSDLTAPSPASYEEKVRTEYIRRIEHSIEEKGNIDAKVSLNDDFSVSRIILSGDVTTGIMFYITTELEVPRSRVEIQ